MQRLSDLKVLENLINFVQEQMRRFAKKKIEARNFPGGPVAKTSCFQCRGPGINPWSGN